MWACIIITQCFHGPPPIIKQVYSSLSPPALAIKFSYYVTVHVGVAYFYSAIYVGHYTSLFLCRILVVDSEFDIFENMSVHLP